VQNTGEPGLGGVTVKLFSGTTLVASAVTSASGTYSFSVYVGTYVVSVSNTITGLSPTTPNLDQTVTSSTATINAAPVGFGLNFTAIRCLKSPALSQGFWKNNVSKALAGKNHRRSSHRSDHEGLHFSSRHARAGALCGTDVEHRQFDI